MSHPKPFLERYNEMLAEALLRVGMIPLPVHYEECRPHPDAYPTLGLRVDLHDSLAPVPSLKGGQCPTCNGPLKTTDSDVRFNSTPTDPSQYIYARGRLACEDYPSHMAELPDTEATVTMETTIAALERLLDDIALEKGY